MPVRPGASYLLSTWLKCEGIDAGDVRVHVHLRKTDGGLSETGAMTSISQGITGTTDWTLVSGLFTMPDDAAQFQIHLTTTASGTVWHDGVSLAEVEPGPIARFECRPLPSPDEFALWQVPSVVKIFPDDPAEKRNDLQISVAGNEREVLQLAVRSGRSIKGVCVKTELIAAPAGSNGTGSSRPFQVFSRGQHIEVSPDDKDQDTQQPNSLPLDINVVGYVPVDYPTSYYRSDAPAWHRLIPTQRPGCDGWAGLWPDPLLPTNRFDLAANTTQAVWLTFDVPTGAIPGDYQYKVRLEAENRVLSEQDCTVHVWDFSLPDENHVAAIYDVRYGRSGSLYWGQVARRDVSRIGPLSGRPPALARLDQTGTEDPLRGRPRRSRLHRVRQSG